MVSRGLTAAQIASLPAVIDLVTAARALGIGRTKAYELAQAGQFPLAVWKVGRSYRVRTIDLQTFLGLAATGAAEVPAVSSPNRTAD
ncbi:helix-turn-helix domain-containing protein [Actinomadura rupiterrae]|uniref:helix-turn-helix domain-containing protein n=1 Tax=Actinomadura rupiterrae TaxID=559627 RepID=UPI0020A425AF|nr:helix-turn-helix domain-containing protein [Actinomadura rupiterrae]MCP2341991.1 excisionase family DNA binding protein [Actinomadura rupiterrae]